MSDPANRGETVEHYLGAVQTLSREDFNQTYPHAFLLECVTSQRGPAEEKPRKTQRLNLQALELPQLPEESQLNAQRVFVLAGLPGGGLTIGRGEEVALRVDGEGVSQMHGKLRLDPGSGNVLVEDLGSTNGTFVNGEPVAPDEPMPLADGDILSLGGACDFQFCHSKTFHSLLRQRVRSSGSR